MKAVFVHDHRFRRINGKIYSPGGLPNEVLSRYVCWFGSLTVVGRIIDEDQAKENYSAITNLNVEVVSRERLEEKVKESNCVIARLPSLNGYKAIRCAKKYNKPYLIEAVGCTFDAYWNYGLKGKALAFPAFMVMRHYIKYAKNVLYVTNEFLQKRYPCKGNTIGVSDVAISSTSEEILKNRIGRIEEEKTTLVLGTAGAIDVEYKGQEYVIRAIPRIIKATGKNVRYELAGAGDARRLQRIAEECGVADKVIFKGTVKHEMIFEWLDSIDIYIQPSLLEGLSRAVVEAMSRGLPCIAAKKGGNPELLEKDCLFSAGNKRKIPDAICCCIQQLASEDRMKHAAQRNYELSNQRYGNQRLTAKRNQWYSDFAHETMG